MVSREDKIRFDRESKDYLEFYRRFMDQRVLNNPRNAANDLYNWSENGRRQFLFLKDNGLKPDSFLLDLGCGTLCLGGHAVPYLNPSHYVGLDISSDAFEAGKKLVGPSIESKKSLLLQNENLKFEELKGRTFDFVMANSVFNHLPIEYFEEFCENIGKIVNENSRIFLTVRLGETYQPIGPPPQTSHNYTTELVNEIVKKNGLTVSFKDMKPYWYDQQRMFQLHMAELRL